MSAASTSATKPCDIGGQVWSAVCLRNPQKASSTPACILEMAVARLRGFREDQRRAPLSLAGRGSLKRDSGKRCHETKKQTDRIENTQKKFATLRSTSRADSWMERMRCLAGSPGQNCGFKGHSPRSCLAARYLMKLHLPPLAFRGLEKFWR